MKNYFKNEAIKALKEWRDSVSEKIFYFDGSDENISRSELVKTFNIISNAIEELTKVE